MERVWFKIGVVIFFFYFVGLLLGICYYAIGAMMGRPVPPLAFLLLLGGTTMMLIMIPLMSKWDSWIDRLEAKKLTESANR